MKFKLVNLDDLESIPKNEVIQYVSKLHDFVKSQYKKLRKFKDKYKKLKTKSAAENRKKKVSESGDDDKGSDLKSEHSKNAQSTSTSSTSETRNNEEAPASFVDEIRQAAEHVQNENGFVYEPTSGLYYDCKTGYYYNAEHGLYYDGNTGCYYKFNTDDNKFEFHSQTYVESNSTKQTGKRKSLSENSSDDQSDHDDDVVLRKRQQRKMRRKTSHRKVNEIDKEDGELSSRSDDSVVLVNESVVYEICYEDVAKKYPPSLRIIVIETNLTKLKVGELFIVTYKGGTLGREGAHDVIIPDINVSKYHLRFTYNDTKSGYECVDLGSRNGTLMNGKRISNAKQESDPVLIIHGCHIQLSQTKLLCHVHDGHTTCRECEPGLIQTAVPVIAQESVERSNTLNHRQELKKIKKRYGLADENYLIPQAMKNDRAAQRRREIGSTGINEKTMMASVEASIPSENKGFKMLSKLGWSQGQTLGKNQTGLLEPISLQSNEGTSGLGCEEKAIVADKKTQKKIELLKITQKRYNNALLTEKNVFYDDGSSSE